MTGLADEIRTDSASSLNSSAGRGYSDLREALDHFEAADRLLRVEEKVGTNDFRIPAAIRNVSDTDGPVLLFENIEGHPGWRVASALYANRRNTCVGLKLADEELVPWFRQVWRDRPMVEPVRVASGAVKEVIIKGDDVNLLDIPIVTHSEHDRGHLINGYIGGGVSIANVPGTKKRETAIVRMTPLSRNTITLFRGGGPLRELMNEQERRGAGLEVAIVLGAEPALAHSTQFHFPKGEVDELAFAGGLRGAPLELVKCETIDVEVPANAEVVLEAVVMPGVRKSDGPYGEFPGTYGASPAAPVVKVQAITRRKDPIYLDVMTGFPNTDNQWLTGPARWAMDYWKLRDLNIDVVDYIRTPASAHTYHSIVSIRKRYDEEAAQVILTLLGSGRRAVGISHVTVVDNDIDIHDPFDVEWAIVNRVFDKERILVLQSGYHSQNPREGGLAVDRRVKWGIDATMPLNDRFPFQKVYVPGQDKVDWRRGQGLFAGWA
jgi:2,5-furandicarboxylate decarboxylase 1